MTALDDKRRYRRTPRGAYSLHKGNAKARGVPFTLTFDQWWAIWDASGRWGERGDKPGCFVMSRRGDVGAYADGNVFIAPFAQNARDGLAKARSCRRPSLKDYMRANGW